MYIYIHWLKALCDTPTPSKQHISPHVLYQNQPCHVAKYLGSMVDQVILKD